MEKRQIEEIIKITKKNNLFCDTFFWYWYKKSHKFCNNEVISEYDGIIEVIQKYGSPDIEDLLVIFDILTSIKDSKKSKGIVYTPSEIVKVMVENAVACFDSVFTVIDPSCGSGIFIYYLAKAMHEKYKISYYELFSKYIYGIDVDDIAAQNTRNIIRCVLLSNRENDCVINNIYNANSLKPDFLETLPKFDCCIGNPPYVRARNLDNRDLSLMNTWSFSSGNSDLYIIFFQIALKITKENGIVSFITPNTYMKSLNGRNMRSFISKQKYHMSIMNFGSAQIFSGATNYTCITTFNKQITDGLVSYIEIQKINDLYNGKFTSFSYVSDNLKAPWIFSNNINELEQIIIIKTQKKKLGSYVIRNGVATLANDIFIFKPKKEDDNYFYHLVDGKLYPIEKGICINMAKPNVIKNELELKSKCEVAIFPYFFGENGKLLVIPETTLKEKYQKTYEYLLEYKNRLMMRDKGNLSKYPAWYAYGRTQGLNNQGKKMLIPYICGKPFCVLSLDCSLLFYCGYALFSDDVNELKALKKVFQSEIFWFYIIKTSKQYSKGYMSLAKNYLVDFGLPDLSRKQIDIINELNTENSINDYLYSLYGCDKQVIQNAIRNWKNTNDYLK